MTNLGILVSDGGVSLVRLLLAGRATEVDIDILIEFEPGKKSFDNFMRLATFLEQQIGRHVELVTPESLSPHIGPHILREVEYASSSS
jgi:predicted nucleotidyltransferase